MHGAGLLAAVHYYIIVFVLGVCLLLLPLFV